MPNLALNSVLPAKVTVTFPKVVCCPPQASSTSSSSSSSSAGGIACGSCSGLPTSFCLTTGSDYANVGGGCFCFTNLNNATFQLTQDTLGVQGDCSWSGSATPCGAPLNLCGTPLGGIWTLYHSGGIWRLYLWGGSNTPICVWDGIADASFSCNSANSFTNPVWAANTCTSASPVTVTPGACSMAPCGCCGTGLSVPFHLVCTISSTDPAFDGLTIPLTYQYDGGTKFFWCGILDPWGGSVGGWYLSALLEWNITWTFFLQAFCTSGPGGTATATPTTTNCNPFQVAGPGNFPSGVCTDPNHLPFFFDITV